MEYRYPDPMCAMRDYCECGCPDSAHASVLGDRVGRCMAVDCNCRAYRLISWSGLYLIPEKINTRAQTEDISYDKESTSRRNQLPRNQPRP